ncbi:LLM class flavin-dependent oxidoreductase [Pelagibacterium sp. H642]|uniref:LLM class flavin-dependent oxidoreductase n=1 Tax=Pelagibacterium sp. H642 TaxID=1881069 RepID=UPI0028153175|nr:LLM class flavin-dependent oxidoreductase [Pelagibacterium sp. H642]WMT91451.1 LLM class flavin-dependent oxidoreductase [Pelagibacterium sp. H642]
MPDYGHELLFGTFTTPSAKDPQHAVSVAQAAEAAGLDAVTIQDHPYNSDFLDTYTLLTWIAAKTSRIRVAANVSNLPLRPPVVLAKAAASIDLLSGGRFEMGLGAGGFGDAIKAAGGPDLTAGQRVDALDEAIEVMRGVWDTSRAGLKHEGEHYKIAGLRRGPRPAHEIGIWLGAYKPRMLALTGAKADGWLPSLDYIKSPTIAESNAMIDEAALAAGRQPSDIKRLLNIMRLSGESAGEWIEQLTGLVLEHGFSGFFFGGDDPEMIRTLGEEIAPAVRAAVDQARAQTGTAAPKSSRALSKRVEGIDYDALPAALSDRAIEPGDFRYGGVRHSYVWSGRPGLVIKPQNAGEVSEAVLYARAQDVPLSVRSGGHGISGRSTNRGGIVIDLGAMNGIEVLDAERGLVRLGPGARWSEVAAKLAEHGLAMSSGDYGGVGVGGLATAGGLGYLARKFGLTIDHVVAAEIVLADGRIVRADAENEPDLFWAIRGAGGNFGIVTAFELAAYRLGNIVQAIQVFDGSDMAGILERWGGLVEASPREVTSFLMAVGRRGGQPPVAQAITVYAGEDTDAAAEAINALSEAGPIIEQRAYLVPYPAIIAQPGGEHHGGGAVIRSGLVEHFTPEIARRASALLSSGAANLLQVRSVGGAVNDVPSDAMAYPHRTQNFSLIAAGSRGSADVLDALWDQLRPLLDGMYLNFETDTHPDRLTEAFPEPALSRLRALKRRYDPGNVFNQNFAIPPAEELREVG